ncbi:MAG: trypsin-like peptidase domain-containing protein [Clostridia bacterium]|nr:trypsin-like peptidase domain-containing protein [Clostridia bacterium]
MFEFENNNQNNEENKTVDYNFRQEKKTAIPIDEDDFSINEEIKKEPEYTYNSYQYNHSQYENNVSPKRRRKNAYKAFGIIALCIAFIGCSILGSFAINFFSNRLLAGKEIPQVSLQESTDEKININTSNKGDELTIPQIAAKVKPSVVGIVVETRSANSYYGIGGTNSGTGSGFIITEDGYIVTNAHVIDGASKITVFLDGVEGEYPANIIGSDSVSDIAVIKINANDLPGVELGDSDTLVIGETVVAIGNPYGLELAGTVTSGIISSANRTITNSEREVKVIQTDAAINPGNSGGPLINSKGQVIGINSMKISSSDSESLGFAIPISDAVEIINSLMKNGYVTERPLIGISGQNIDEMASRVYGLPKGVYITGVDASSDAKKKGIMPYDIVIGADGKTVESMSQLNAIKEKFKAGDSLTLKIWRSGKTLEFTIILGEDKPTMTN